MACVLYKSVLYLSFPLNSLRSRPMCTYHLALPCLHLPGSSCNPPPPSPLPPPQPEPLILIESSAILAAPIAITRDTAEGVTFARRLSAVYVFHRQPVEKSYFVWPLNKNETRHDQSISSKLFSEMTAVTFLLSEWHFCITYRMHTADCRLQPAACGLHMRDGRRTTRHPNLRRPAIHRVARTFLFRGKCQERISRPPSLRSWSLQLPAVMETTIPALDVPMMMIRTFPGKPSSTDD